MIENAFGLLKGRWNICFNNRISDPAEARDVALICCALHNFVQKRGIMCEFDDAGDADVQPARLADRARDGMAAGDSVRNALAEYTHMLMPASMQID